MNKHDWSNLFSGDMCRICYRSIATGTGKAEHARKHVRENKAALTGEGTTSNPFRYIITATIK